MNVVLLLSGGLDSTILLHHLLSQGHGVRALSIQYGQRHHREINAATEIAHNAGIEHRVLDLSHFASLCTGSALTDNKVSIPHGHYTDESMKVTVVPNRNMVFISMAAAWAISTKSDAVAYAAHAGDHAIYPDCRQEFAEAMNKALSLCDWHHLQLLRPFVDFTKGEICSRGAELGAPFSLTWSCYEGGPSHCGACGTCVERKEAFRLAGVLDPTIYLE